MFATLLLLQLRLQKFTFWNAISYFRQHLESLHKFIFSLMTQLTVYTLHLTNTLHLISQRYFSMFQVEEQKAELEKLKNEMQQVSEHLQRTEKEVEVCLFVYFLSFCYKEFHQELFKKYLMRKYKYRVANTSGKSKNLEKLLETQLV